MSKKLLLTVFICGLITTANAQNWSSVSGGGRGCHTLAIKADGTLWAWGHNTSGSYISGQLGLGSTRDKDTPTQVSTATNWSSVSCGDSYTLAIKTDGTLWAWGYNFFGQLGLGGKITFEDTPTQVSTTTNWSSVSCGIKHTLAIKTDGTLWAWGCNDENQLGFNDPGNIGIPIQVGTGCTHLCIGNNNKKTSPNFFITETKGLSPAPYRPSSFEIRILIIVTIKSDF